MRAKKDDSARKQRLIASLQAAMARDGSLPGVRQFCREVGENKKVFEGRLWATWRDFVREAGFPTGDLQGLTRRIDDDELFRHLAELTRKLGRYPTVARLTFEAQNDSSIPSEKVFRTHFGGIPAACPRLREWVAGESEYADVLRILDQAPPCAPRTRPTHQPLPATGTLELSDSYLPPVVAHLAAMATGDAAIEALCESRGLDLNLEFERRVGAAFSLLGLGVEQLGQGNGRVADGLATCNAGHWGVIFDAKVRRGRFTMGTEDRKFRDYIDNHALDFEKRGITSTYFSVVSSSFAPADLEKAEGLVHQTRAKAVSLVEASALQRLVELTLRRAMGETEFQRLLGKTQIVSLDVVDRLK